MDTKANREAKAGRMGILSICISILGCLVGYFVNIGGDNSFGPGLILAFVALLLSLMSVENQGHNLLAKIAFILSVASLFFVAAMGAVQA